MDIKRKQQRTKLKMFMRAMRPHAIYAGRWGAMQVKIEENQRVLN